MKAYKFRSSQQMEYVFDILLNSRLYCADWTKLNDPVEGIFSYSYTSATSAQANDFIQQVGRAKRPLRVCSLSRTFDCHLLWAHYAGGFTGLALEVDLPEESPEVVEVEYRGVFASISASEGLSPDAAARRVLSSKYREWQYEQEVRVLSTSDWYSLNAPVRRVIVGHRMSKSLFDAIRIVCESKNITVNRTGIGDEGIDADFVPRLGEPW